MAQFFIIRSQRVSVVEIDKWWFFKKLWNILRMRSYRRMFGYFMVCDVPNNKKINVGDRFIAGNYYPPIIFEVVKKLGTNTITARSLVISTYRQPDFTGKSILLTKKQN